MRWDDVDALQHVKHTTYSTLATQTRIRLFADYGVRFSEPGSVGEISPVLFREELLYRREMTIHDTATVNAAISELNPEASRWAVRHQLFRSDGELSATVTVSGAWLDLAERKLTMPSVELAQLMWTLPQTDDFVELPSRNRP